MISNILPTFTSLITLPTFSPSWPKCVAQLAVAQLDCRPVVCRPVGLSPRWAYTVSAVYATARWLGGWVAVRHTPVAYCIKTAKSILKLFRPSGSPIILVSSVPCADTSFQGKLTPSAVAIYTRRVKNWRFSTEIAVYLGNGATCEIGRWLGLLWNVNRKSWVVDLFGIIFETFWLWVTPNRVSRSRYIYTWNISQMVREFSMCTKLSLGALTKPCEKNGVVAELFLLKPHNRWKLFYTSVRN